MRVFSSPFSEIEHQLDEAWEALKMRRCDLYIRLETATDLGIDISRAPFGSMCFLSATRIDFVMQEDVE